MCQRTLVLRGWFGCSARVSHNYRSHVQLRLVIDRCGVKLNGLRKRLSVKRGCANTARKFGAHSYTNRGTCPDVGSEFTAKAATSQGIQRIRLQPLCGDSRVATPPAPAVQTKPRYGPPVVLPGADVWRHTWGDDAPEPARPVMP
jgi:hypothetical protein